VRYAVKAGNRAENIQGGQGISGAVWSERAWKFVRRSRLANEEFGGGCAAQVVATKALMPQEPISKDKPTSVAVPSAIGGPGEDTRRGQAIITFFAKVK